jgi:hypothetical protein
VPARDRRTLDELLADSETLARETLFDVSADQGPAMLPTWGQMIQAAAQLWISLPPDAAQAPDPHIMARLYTLGRGIGRTVTVGGWPGPGPYDERLLEIGLNLAQATVVMERGSGGGPAGFLTGQSEARSGRSQLVHTLYFVAHGVGVTRNAYLAQQEQRLHVDTQRRRRMVDRPDRAEVTAGRDVVARLGVFEQVAGDWVSAHPAGPAQGASSSLRSLLTCRLESALATWDVQAHRTLAAAPDVPDLVRVARVQALIAATTGVVTRAAAHNQLADREAVRRLTPFLQQAEAAWTRTAKGWGELAAPASRADPALIRAASEVRAAISAAACTRTGWASPAHLAGRVDLAQTIQTFHLASATAVDIAHVGREVAATNRHLTTTARAQAVPLHESVRRGLVNLTEEVIVASGQAAAAAAALHPSTPPGQTANRREAGRSSGYTRIAVMRPGPEGPRP